MKKTWAVAAAFAATAISGIGAAAAQNLCLPPGGGVPFDPGPPVWKDFNGGISPTAPVKATHDDPRWLGSLGVTYTTNGGAGGSANPPIQFRGLWGYDGSMTAAPPAGYGTNRYIYLQWVVRVGVWGSKGAQDVVISFDRPNQGALGPSAKRSFLLRFRLGNPVSVPIDPEGKHISTSLYQCTSGTACPDTDDFFEVYERTAAPTPAETGCNASGDMYKFTFQPTAIPWLERSLQYERRCASTDPNTCTKWIISVRIPVVNADASLDEAAQRGMEEGSQISYQLNAPAWDHDNNIITPDLVAMIDNWPRAPGTINASPTTIYVDGAATKSVCKETDSDFGGGAGSGSDPWSTIPLWNGDDGSRAALGCFGGWRLDWSKIGTRWRVSTDPAPTPTDLLTGGFEWSFKAEMSAGVRATNTVTAVPINNTGTACGGGTPCPRFKARFRLAEWGSQPAGSNAVFGDIRGSVGPTGGVCAEPPGGGSPTLCGQSGAANQPVMRFDWQIGGTGADFTEALEFCQHGLAPTAGYPWVCVDNCNLPSGTCVPASGLNCGVRADPTVPGPVSSPCVRKLWYHQCMMVELDSDDAANIEIGSVFRNMDLVQMSETKQEATISTGGMPPIPGQRNEEIYLIVMPRNMPASLPAGTTGTTMVQQNAGAARDSLVGPYEEAARNMSDAEYAAMVEQINGGAFGGYGYGGQRYGGPAFDNGGVIGEPTQEVPGADLGKGARLMPRNLRRIAEVYDGLSRFNTSAENFTHTTLNVFDSVTATAIVPTLDIYSYRRVGYMLIPMTSFSMVVFHEGPLYGVSWEIDGTTKLGPNLFRIEMPNGHKKRIQVRAMAKESPGDHQTKGDKKWPCAGGCCGKQGYCSEPAGIAGLSGTLLPVGVAGVIFAGMGWRRRRKKARQAKD